MSSKCITTVHDLRDGRLGGDARSKSLTMCHLVLKNAHFGPTIAIKHKNSIILGYKEHIL